jgi:hypothetical protein
MLLSIQVGVRWSWLNEIGMEQGSWLFHQPLPTILVSNCEVGWVLLEIRCSSVRVLVSK